VGLNKYKGKVLFINGDQDHRDSEHIWLNACKDSELKVYEKADHFFSHDTRFMERFIKDC
jgi:alpha/beta superfamily hydrolase